MAGGSSNDQPTENSPDKMPKHVDQTTTAEATLTIVQALKLQFDGLSTWLDKQKEINMHRADLATNDYEDEDEDEDDVPRAYRDILPRMGLQRLSLFKTWRYEADLYFTEVNKTASRDEHRHIVCYVVFHEAPGSAATTPMATLIWALNATTRTKKEALDFIDTALRTFAAVGDAHEARSTASSPPSIEDKHLAVGLAVAAKATAAAPFKKKEREQEYPDTAAWRKTSKHKTAPDKRAEVEAKYKNDKGDEGKGKANE
eukprot:jgi/Tetstr1/443725/TSEL_031715.t1